jgi:hypothetical protein
MRDLQTIPVAVRKQGDKWMMIGDHDWQTSKD